jgi:hypothetical protein
MGYLKAKFNVLLGQGCARSHAVHSSVALCVHDRIKCAIAHVIALKTHSIAGEAMVASATRADEACA